MKNMKRVLSLVLAIAMLVSCFAITAFADETTATAEKTSKIFSDVLADSEYIIAVETFNKLGVIKGYEDGTFRPLQNVTRAEFTAMLMRTLNYGSVGSTSAADLPFSDVSDTDTSINWAIPNINSAYGMGIINGYEDGTFRPNANVAFEEAVKMIVCTLGYGKDVDTSATPWYSPYTTQAARLGITKNTTSLGGAGTPASRACIAQLLYDSLEVKLIENGEITDKTILTEYMGYIKNTGIVASNGITSLTSPDVNLGEGEVQIYAQEPGARNYETYTYIASDDDLKNYLGYEIEYYYKKGGGRARELALYVVNPVNEIEIAAEKLEKYDSTDTQVEYYESDSSRKTTALKLNEDNIVIYNGKLYGETDDDSRFDVDMIPLLGSIHFIDSNGDKKYDILKINNYDVYYVSSKVAAEYAIIDDVLRTTDKTLYLDVDGDDGRTRIVDTNGKEISYNTISVGDIICLAMSKDDNGGEVLKTAVVCDDTVTGTVTGTGDNSIRIGSKSYNYSNAAPWMSDDEDIRNLLEEPDLQDSGVYCLDINGNIVAYKATEVVENMYYGYIMGYAKPKTSGFSNDYRDVRVINQNGSEEMIILNEDTRINGSKCSNIDDAIEFLEETASIMNNDPDADEVGINQVIKYTTRNVSGGKAFAKIYVAEEATNGGEIKSDKLNYYGNLDASEAVDYNGNAKQFRGENGLISVNNSIIFVVPSDRKAFDDYAKKNPFKHNKTYYIEAFDVAATGNAKVVVCYGESSATEVDEYSPVNVVMEDIEERLNSDNERMEYMSAYSSSYSNAKGTLEEWISPDAEYTPEKGDIFRAGTDKDGYAMLLEDNLIYRVGETDESAYKLEKSSTDMYNSYYTMILGSVVAMDSSSVSILPEYVDEDYDQDEAIADAENFLFSEFSGARILQYDNSGKELEITDVSDDYEGVLRSLVPYKEGSGISPTRVMLYMSKGKIRMFCVLDED